MEINIGRLIEEERRHQGMSHTKMARLINTTRSNVNNIEKRHSIDTELLKRISRALKTNFFALLAKELEKEGFDEPSERTTDMLTFTLQDDDKEFIVIEDVNDGYQEIDVLDVSLIINSVNFDETIELPQEIFPLLMHAYSCALDGPLKDLDEESLDFEFFPWLERNHPRLASAIGEATEGLLIERIEDDVDGKYRDIINYLEPTIDDDWYELADNDIKYLIGNLPDRIHKVKRPSSWLLPIFDY